MAESYFASIAVSSGCLGVPVQDSDLVQLLRLGVSPSVRQKKGGPTAASFFWYSARRLAGLTNWKAQVPKPMRETE